VGQACPQLPQLLGSEEVSERSWHEPLQQAFCRPSVSEPQRVPIAPQLFGSEAIFWHTPALHVVPVEHLLLQLPQLLLSLAVMTLTHLETPLEVHNDCPAVHELPWLDRQRPSKQVPLPPQEIPQPPQLLGSFFVL